MQTRTGLLVFSVVFYSVFLLGSGSMALAEGLEGKSGKEIAQIAYGGLLYDKWTKVLDVDGPKDTHPAYASSKGKRKGGGTWRCKECHGWDYMGKDGAYAKGSHFSGISGIRGSVNSSVANIAAELKDGEHGLGKYADSAALEAMAAFVAYGQMDMNTVIDRGTKKAKGNAARGEGIYLTTCAKCHGTDGKKLDFGDEKKPVFLGTVANSNPWETLHKIRMGQPGEEMTAMIAFPVEMQVDVLTYAQTLPQK